MNSCNAFLFLLLLYMNEGCAVLLYISPCIVFLCGRSCSVGIAKMYFLFGLLLSLLADHTNVQSLIIFTSHELKPLSL